MLVWKIRDSLFKLRRRFKFFLVRNCIDTKRVNLGAFQDFCDLSIACPLYKDAHSLDSDTLNAELRTKFGPNTKLIYVDLDLVEKARDFLYEIKGEFSGAFVINTLDLSLERTPDWVGPDAKWFAPNIVDPKNSSGHLIPLGVEDRRRAGNNLPWYFASTSEKYDSILVGPFGNTHFSRLQLGSLADTSTITVLTQRLKPRKYAELSAKYKFIYCPRGNGIDTHRLWETLYRKSIPILDKSLWSEYLCERGIPALLINNVDELNKYSREDLHQLYATLLSALEDCQYLLSNDYWENKLRASFES